MTGVARLLLILIALLPLAADDHYIESRKGLVQPLERWVGDQRAWFGNGRFHIIRRLDLGREWVISPARNRYLERVPAKGGSLPSAPVRLLEAECGWEPVAFEWQALDTGRIEAVDGRACRVVSLEGDSDYARTRIQLWIDPEAPVDMAQYNRLVRAPGLEPALLAIYETAPVLQRGAVLKRIKEEAFHFGAPRVEESRVQVQRAEPPPGLYELPKDCVKVATQAELVN